MMTDPIADMLTRIRNANNIERPAVEMAATKQKRNIAQVLKDEGYILDFQVGHYVADEKGQQVFHPDDDFSKPKSVLRVFLKYGPEGEMISVMTPITSPSRLNSGPPELPRLIAASVWM